MYPRYWYRGAISPLTDARETIKNTDGLASRPFTFSVPKSMTVPFLKDSTVILPEFFFFFFDFAKVGLAINIKAHAKPIIIFFIFLPPKHVPSIYDLPMLVKILLFGYHCCLVCCGSFSNLIQGICRSSLLIFIFTNRLLKYI